MPSLTLPMRVVFAALMLACSLSLASAHEGHDHDKPPPLAFPVAPRVVAVTPELELVGVASGQGRLTVFLHAFATNEAIKGAGIVVSLGDLSADAKPDGDGVYTVAAPWLDATGDLDLIFTLKLADGADDLMTGTLRRVPAQSLVPASEPTEWRIASIAERPFVLLSGAAGLALGVLLTLLFGGGRQAFNGPVADKAATEAATDIGQAGRGQHVTHLRRSASAVAGIVAVALSSQADRAVGADALVAALPSIPATMATDLAQRMPDGSLFVPKATQHLLSIRTMLTVETEALRAIELTGTVIAGPANFGRVQPGRPGRIEATHEGMAYLGKQVRKGDVLAYVQTYIEAADRANIVSLIAETEARIEKSRTILSRYEASPGSVPQVKIDEVRGELEALTRKRAELLPSVARREPVLAPINGIVSLSNATIGQIVESRDILFEIVDPSELWVEAHGHNHETAALQDMSAAFAIDKHGHRLRLDLAGRSPILRHQASITNFRILDRHDSLAIGMPVKVVVQSKSRITGLMIPAAAITRGPTGLPIVWVKSDAERFEPHVVRHVPLDGVSVVVTAGLGIDTRVVTDGVTLLNQVR